MISKISVELGTIMELCNETVVELSWKYQGTSCNPAMREMNPTGKKGRREMIFQLFPLRFRLLLPPVTNRPHIGSSTSMK